MCLGIGRGMEHQIVQRSIDVAQSTAYQDAGQEDTRWDQDSRSDAREGVPDDNEDASVLHQDVSLVRHKGLDCVGLRLKQEGCKPIKPLVVLAQELESRDCQIFVIWAVRRG